MVLVALNATGMLNQQNKKHYKNVSISAKKWVQESNPNANYDQVSELYKDLSRSVEGQRDGFFMQEKMIQGIVLEHSNLLGKFPGSFYNIFFGRKPLEYKPITSDRTDDVIRTGKDNDVKLF